MPDFGTKDLMKQRGKNTVHTIWDPPKQGLEVFDEWSKKRQVVLFIFGTLRASKILERPRSVADDRGGRRGTGGNGGSCCIDGNSCQGDRLVREGVSPDRRFPQRKGWCMASIEHRTCYGDLG